MATATGTKGSVTVGEGPTINITEWETDERRTIHDDTYFDGVNISARTKVGGMATLFGKCRGWARTGVTPAIIALQTTGVSATDIGGAFALETDSSTTPHKGYSFTGVLSNVVVDVVKIDLIAVSFDFQSQGEVIQIAA